MPDPLDRPELDPFQLDDPASLVPSNVPMTRPGSAWFWPVLVLSAVGYAGLWVAGAVLQRNETQNLAEVGTSLLKFAQAGLVVVPFVPLVVLAQLGRVSTTARAVTVLYWAMFAAFGMLILLGLTLAAQ